MKGLVRAQSLRCLCVSGRAIKSRRSGGQGAGKVGLWLLESCFYLCGSALFLGLSLPEQIEEGYCHREKIRYKLSIIVYYFLLLQVGSQPSFSKLFKHLARVVFLLFPVTWVDNFVVQLNYPLVVREKPWTLVGIGSHFTACQHLLCLMIMPIRVFMSWFSLFLCVVVKKPILY